MSMKDIFCQDKAIGMLQRALAFGRVPHAYIFAGPEGVGKFMTASQWARLLLCEKPVSTKVKGETFSDSCGNCKSCTLFEAGSHPDFNHIYKELREFTIDGKGKAPPVDMPIDVIREFVIAKAPLRPTFSKRKVFVITEAEKLNAFSQNCLLKILEEPPDFCCIILLCTRLDKLLATTRSRCQIVRFGPIAVDKIVEKLIELNLERDKAVYFARLSQGSLGLACTSANLELAGAELFRIKKDMVQDIVRLELPGCLESAELFSQSCKAISGIWSELEKDTSKTDINRRSSGLLISMVASVFHDIITLNVRPGIDLINSDQAGLIKNLAAKVDVELAAANITECYRMLNWIESNVNEKLIFEQLLLSLARSDRIPA